MNVLSQIHEALQVACVRPSTYAIGECRTRLPVRQIGKEKSLEIHGGNGAEVLRNRANAFKLVFEPKKVRKPTINRQKFKSRMPQGGKDVSHEIDGEQPD